MTVARPGPAAAAPLAALGVSTLAAWLALSRLDTMAARPAAFLLGWTLMMTAMMLPSAAPLVLLYGSHGRLPLVLGYLAVWAAIGVPVYALAAAVDLMTVPTRLVACVLAIAGVYQFTPLKNACLRACRSPLDFIALRWGRTPLRIGVEHGAYCVGCCWALMAVLVLAAAMTLPTALAIGAAVFAEKVLPGGRWTARASGVALLVASLVVLV